MNSIIKILLLQIKFLLVAFLNFSYVIFPPLIRNLYFRFWGIKIKCSSTIHRNCKFFHIGKITIGNNSVINFGCYLDNRRGITIGNNVGVAHNTKIYTLGHNINDPLFRTKGGEVIIEDDVFIFSNSIIMPSITIHKGAIVLPGSVVTKDVLPYSVVGGNPAKFIKQRDKNIEYKLNYHYLFAL